MAERWRRWWLLDWWCAVKPVISIDEDANVGYVTFSEEKVATTLPVRDGDAVVVTLSFSEGGALVGVELLNAAVQLPGASS